MLLHHLCTLSLVIFSYLTNYSNLGSIVLFLHNTSDIFVYLTRLLIQTDSPEWIKNLSGIFLTCSMLYTRLYVFGQAIYTLYFYATWEWGFTLDFLFLFLTFLYLMHINWCVLLLSKFYLIVVGNRLSDTVEFKKVKNK